MKKKDWGGENGGGVRWEMGTPVTHLCHPPPQLGAASRSGAGIPVCAGAPPELPRARQHTVGAL